MSNSAAARGRLFVVSAPSGTGKTTVVEAVIARTAGLVRSRSYTSRPARIGEVDGDAYHFVSRARFESMIAGDQFLEWAQFGQHLYGTAVLDTERELAAGHDVVFVIEVQGARQLRRREPAAVGVFLLPPAAEELERRLRERNQDTADDIARRLETARIEVRAYSEYDYVVVNDDLDACVGELRAIVLAERARLPGSEARAASVAATFERWAGQRNAGQGA
jgi:guanylate kinase